MATNRVIDMRNGSAQAIVDEKDLVRRMRAGEEAAFDYFSRHHVPALYRFAIARLGGDRQFASDIVQATLCKALAKLGTYRGEGPLLGWLCSCCRNEIAMQFRKTPREVDLEGAPPGNPALLAPSGDEPEERLLAVETSERVHMVLDLLPEHYAKVLEWKYVDGLSVREIGEQVSLTEKAAESLLTRARVAFREAWGRSGGGSLGAELRSEAR